MSHNLEFTWDIFINMVDDLFYENIGRRVTNLERELLRCFWNEMSPASTLRVLDENRAELNYYYNDIYFRIGLQPNLMRKLSEFIGEPVNRRNFKEVFRRIWYSDS